MYNISTPIYNIYHIYTPSLLPLLGPQGFALVTAWQPDRSSTATAVTPAANTCPLYATNYASSSRDFQGTVVLRSSESLNIHEHVEELVTQWQQVPAMSHISYPPCILI